MDRGLPPPLELPLPPELELPLDELKPPKGEFELEPLELPLLPEELPEPELLLDELELLEELLDVLLPLEPDELELLEESEPPDPPEHADIIIGRASATSSNEKLRFGGGAVVRAVGEGEPSFLSRGL